MGEDSVFSGEGVEEAIAKGLTTLGLSREQVTVDVLDEGGRGMLGIGARSAKVRLTPLASPPPEPVATAAAAAEATTPPAPPDPSAYVETARDELARLLKLLGFSVTIHTYQAEAASDEETSPLVLDVRDGGADLNTLIGRKGETLAALQHVTRLLVSRRISEQANLVVDVEGFKRRREYNLRRLAERMADRAVKESQTVVLEPMPAYERRIIHLTLRNREDVRTESVGMGYQRRVTIIPRAE
jgi:spoIIIJ-associated protein